jgi:two-component sensor histidine kinase
MKSILVLDDDLEAARAAARELAREGLELSTGSAEGAAARLASDPGIDRVLLGREAALGLFEMKPSIERALASMDSVHAFSMTLESVPFEEMHVLVARKAREIFGASAAAVGHYDERRKAIVIEAIDWAPGKEGLVTELIGRGLVGMLTPIGDEEYLRMMELQIGVASRLSDFSFGHIPQRVGEAIEKVLGLGWLRGLVLASQGKLIGGLALAGGRDREPPESGVLLVFAEIAASAIKRKEAEARIESLLREKEALLHEVHHRVKNNMGTMVSILSLQSRACGEGPAREALLDAMGRLQSMGTLYDKLYRSEELREMSLRDYLPALVEEIVAQYPNAAQVELRTEIEDFPLGVKPLSTLGILVNELVSNAMKYAFPGGRRGAIRVSARAKERRVLVLVEDDGIGMPAGVGLESSTGFGLGLVAILAEQLGGSIALSRRRGASFRLEFDRDSAG